MGWGIEFVDGLGWARVIRLATGAAQELIEAGLLGLFCVGFLIAVEGVEVADPAPSFLFQKACRIQGLELPDPDRRLPIQSDTCPSAWKPHLDQELDPEIWSIVTGEQRCFNSSRTAC